MWFSRQEIAFAFKLRDAGLDWSPYPGSYIWDANKKIRPTSPFQRGVYFLLDVDCFIAFFGGVENLKRAVVWLPTWEQCRIVLEHYGATHQEIASRLRSEKNLERLTLYKLIGEHLQRQALGRKL